MAALTQNQLERLQDMIAKGELTVDAANVLKVQWQRVVIVHKLPAQVRKALTEGVKLKQVGYMKKEGAKPAVYYNLDFKHLADETRREEEQKTKNAILNFHGYGTKG